jgi:hypothetical protein
MNKRNNFLITGLFLLVVIPLVACSQVSEFFDLEERIESAVITPTSAITPSAVEHGERKVDIIPVLYCDRWWFDLHRIDNIETSWIHWSRRPKGSEYQGLIWVEVRWDDSKQIVRKEWNLVDFYNQYFTDCTPNAYSYNYLEIMEGSCPPYGHWSPRGMGVNIPFNNGGATTFALANTYDGTAKVEEKDLPHGKMGVFHLIDEKGNPAGKWIVQHCSGEIFTTGVDNINDIQKQDQAED